MTQIALETTLWTVQMQLAEQVLKPLENLLHHRVGNNPRFFAAASDLTERADITANLHVVLALIDGVRRLQASMAEAKKVIVDDNPSDMPVNS